MRILAFVALLAAILAGGAAKANERAFPAGSWNGVMYLKDDKVIRCSIWMPFINRWDLSFVIQGDGAFSLRLHNSDLDLQSQVLFKSRMAMRLQLDDTPVIIRPFEAMTTKVVATAFATNLDWVARLPNSKVLRVNTGSRTWRFPLTGLKEALPKLHACAKQYVRA